MLTVLDVSDYDIKQAYYFSGDISKYKCIMCKCDFA